MGSQLGKAGNGSGASDSAGRPSCSLAIALARSHQSALNERELFWTDFSEISACFRREFESVVISLGGTAKHSRTATYALQRFENMSTGFFFKWAHFSVLRSHARVKRVKKPLRARAARTLQILSNSSKGSTVFRRQCRSAAPSLQRSAVRSLALLYQASQYPAQRRPRPGLP